MAKKETKEFRMETLLLAAQEEFLNKGYEGASMDAIARRAGVSKGGLYYHFPNKDVLLMEVNAKLTEPLIAMAVKALENPSPITGLKHYIRDYLEYCGQSPKEMSFFFLFMSKALQSPVLLDYFKRYVQDNASFYIAMYQKALTNNEVENICPEVQGVALMGALDGLATYALIHPKAHMDQLMVQFIKTWFREE